MVEDDEPRENRIIALIKIFFRETWNQKILFLIYIGLFTARINQIVSISFYTIWARSFFTDSKEELEEALRVVSEVLFWSNIVALPASLLIGYLGDKVRLCTLLPMFVILNLLSSLTF